MEINVSCFRFIADIIPYQWSDDAANNHKNQENDAFAHLKIFVKHDKLLYYASVSSKFPGSLRIFIVVLISLASTS